MEMVPNQRVLEWIIRLLLACSVDLLTNKSKRHLGLLFSFKLTKMLVLNCQLLPWDRTCLESTRSKAGSVVEGRFWDNRWVRGHLHLLSQKHHRQRASMYINVELYLSLLPNSWISAGCVPVMTGKFTIFWTYVFTISLIFPFSQMRIFFVLL